MNRSPLIRRIALAAALFALVSLPAQAQPRAESITTVASRVWQAFLGALPGFPVRASLSAAARTAPGDRGADLDPDGFTKNGDRGVDIDPDGSAIDGDRGAGLDPNGFATDGDRSASLDPNG